MLAVREWIAAALVAFSPAGTSADIFIGDASTYHCTETTVESSSQYVSTKTVIDFGNRDGKKVIRYREVVVVTSIDDPSPTPLDQGILEMDFEAYSRKDEELQDPVSFCREGGDQSADRRSEFLETPAGKILACVTRRGMDLSAEAYVPFHAVAEYFSPRSEGESDGYGRKCELAGFSRGH